MSWSWLIGAAAIAGSLYWFALVGYRLLLSVKGMQAAGLPLKSNLDLLAQPIEREFTAAKNHTEEDLGEVLAKRKQLINAKRDSAEDRRRRLIERLNQMNLDKR
jgi:hypothetical protein